MSWELFFKFVVPSVLGAGFAGAWIGWQIEKRRSKMQYRMSLVKSWREQLIPIIREPRANGDVYSFTRLPAYASLRPHLSRSTLQAIEGRTVVAGDDGLRRAMMTEIGEIERKWGLV